MDKYNNIIKTGSCIGQYEILNTCIKLKINICIYKLETESSNYNKFSLKYETFLADNDTYNPFNPTILIAWISQNHYELLLPKNVDKEEYPAELYLLDNEFNLNSIIDNKANNLLPFNDNDKDIFNNKEKENVDINNSLRDKYKKELTSFIKNDKSIYRSIKSTKYGDTRLEDILNFQIPSKNYNGKKEKNWPKYIKDAAISKKNLIKDLRKKIQKEKKTL
jgi:hypothetical protein